MAGSIARGLASIQERQESRASTGTKSLNKFPWLKDGQTAEFWFATDGDEIRGPLLHIKAVPKKGGISAGTWNKDVLCEKSYGGDDAACQYCDAGRNEDGKAVYPGPFMRTVGLVYVTKIVSNARFEGAVPLKLPGGQTIYVLEPNEVRLMVAKDKFARMIFDAYSGDPLDPDFETRTKTLLDRPFRVKRSGTGAQAMETLQGLAPAEMPDHVRKAIADAGDIDEIIVNDFTERVRGSGGAARSESAVADDLAGFDLGSDAEPFDLDELPF